MMQENTETEQADFRGILSDVLLWLVLGALIATGIYYGAVALPRQHRQVLTLTFQDANEMTRGANVRMMGLDIGYVDDIRVRENRVDVVIKTSPDAPKIPPGSLATIQFTGLVGSKSIEIIPAPQSQRVSGDQYLDVEEPIRLKDYFDYNIEIAQALQMGAENFSDFFGKRKPVEELQHNIRTSERVTANAGMHLQNGLTRMATFRGEYDASSDEFFTVLEHSRRTTDHAAEMLDREVFGPSVFAVLHYGEALFSEGAAAFRRFQGEEGYLDVEDDIVAVQCGIQQTCEQFARLDLKEKAVGADRKLTQIYRGLDRADAFLQVDRTATFSTFHAGLEAFNTQLRRLMKAF